MQTSKKRTHEQMQSSKPILAILQRECGVSEIKSVSETDAYAYESVTREWRLFTSRDRVAGRDDPFLYWLTRGQDRACELYNQYRETGDGMAGGFWRQLTRETLDPSFSPWMPQTCRQGKYFLPRQTASVEHVGPGFSARQGTLRPEGMQLGIIVDFVTGQARVVQASDHALTLTEFLCVGQTQNDSRCTWTSSTSSLEMKCEPKVQVLMDRWWRHSPQLIALVLDCILAEPCTLSSRNRLDQEWPAAVEQLKEHKA